MGLVGVCGFKWWWPEVVWVVVLLVPPSADCHEVLLQERLKLTKQGNTACVFMLS